MPRFLKPITNKRGAAYLIVVIVMITLFSFSVLMLRVAENDVLAAGAYAHNIGGYEAAVSGVKQTVRLLQYTIDENRPLINETVLNKILTYSIDDIIEYDAGGYRFKGGCFYHKLFAAYAVDYLAPYISGAKQLELQCETASYTVTITVTKGLNNEYTINSVSENNTTNVKTTVSAVLAFAYCDNETVTVENSANGLRLREINLSDENAGNLEIKSLTKIGY